MLQTLVQHPYFQLGVAILAPLGILISYILYRRSLRVKVPRYLVSSRTIVSASKAAIPDLTFAYKGSPQKKIVVTRIVIWNEGRESIRANDLVAGDPLRLQFPKGIGILDVSLVETTAKGIQATYELKVIEENPCLILSFNYLDYRDAFLLQVIHDGAATGTLILRGKIVGCSEIQRHFEAPTARNLKRFNAIFDRLFGKNLKLFPYFVVAVYGGISVIGVSMWFFRVDTGASVPMMTMVLPALGMLPAALRKKPPLDVYADKKVLGG